MSVAKRAIPLQFIVQFSTYKKRLALAHCLAVPFAAVAADGSYKITYDGGSVQGLKPGNDMKLFIETNQIRIMRDNKEAVIIPTAAITEISYGQDAHRRVGAAIGLAVVSFGIGPLMALSKSKKHFVGLTWDDAGKASLERKPSTRTRLR